MNNNVDSSGIEGKLAVHDRHQFELKLDYTLDPNRPVNNYKIELYFFLPKSLGINHHTYSKRYFFSDIQGYIRFKTPTFSFDDLINPNNSRAPFTRIVNILASPEPSREKLITELKLYACTLRVALRNSVNQITKKIKRQDAHGIEEEVKKVCGSTVNCLSTLRSLESKINSPKIHADVVRAYQHADEYLGIVVDDFLNLLNNTILESNLNEAIKRDLNYTIAPIILGEFDYRKKHDYITYVKNSENELFLYRKSLLKKLVTSILFLETHTQEGSPYIKDLIFAIVAGMAMLIFVVVSFWAGRRWRSSSIPFALALVLGYIVKDRIKDWLKLIFSKKMTSWFSDFKTAILDPETNKKIGICKQAFSFISERSVPEDVINLRKRGHHHSTDFWIPEDIIKYEKDVSLKPVPITKTHTRLSDITDIIRFNIHRFLYKMDDPEEIQKAYDPTTEKITEFECARVYHVNIVMKLTDQVHGMDQLRRIRLVLDQEGLKRVEGLKFEDPLVEASLIK